MEWKVNESFSNWMHRFQISLTSHLSSAHIHAGTCSWPCKNVMMLRSFLFSFIWRSIISLPFDLPHSRCRCVLHFVCFLNILWLGTFPAKKLKLLLTNILHKIYEQKCDAKEFYWTFPCVSILHLGFSSDTQNFTRIAALTCHLWVPSSKQ